jgi:hypothetical protein
MECHINKICHSKNIHALHSNITLNSLYETDRIANIFKHSNFSYTTKLMCIKTFFQWCLKPRQDFKFTRTAVAYSHANKFRTFQKSTQSKVFPALSSLWSHIGGKEVQLHILFNLGTGWRWLVNTTLRPLQPRYSMNIRVCGPSESVRANRRTDNSLDLSGIRNSDHVARSLVIRLSDLLKFPIKKTLRKISGNSNRVHLKHIIACCVIINQKAIKWQHDLRLSSGDRNLAS